MTLDIAFKKLIDSFGSDVLRNNIRLERCFNDYFIKDQRYLSICKKMIYLDIFEKFYIAEKDGETDFKQETASECADLMCDKLIKRYDSVMAVNALCFALGWSGVSVASDISDSDQQTSNPESESQVNCTNCGKPVVCGIVRCSYCGCNMSEKQQCFLCGNLINKNVLFCKYCGVKISSPNIFSASSENHYILSSLSLGDTVEFGRYPQDANSTEMPIKWRVLDKTTEKVLLVSEYALEYVKYHNEHAEVTWDECDLRKWLNGDFYNKAFNISEKSIIAEMRLINSNNPQYGTYGGNDTYDKIFCLSVDDLEKNLPLTKEGKCREKTDYAMEQNSYNRNARNWLRSPGSSARSAAYVDSDGIVCASGMDVAINFAAVPALWSFQSNQQAKLNS